MKKGLKIGIFVLALVVCWSFAVLAAQVTINNTYSVNVEVFDSATNTAVSPQSGDLSSYVDGYTYYPYDYGNANPTASGYPPLSTSADAPGTIWLTTLKADADWTDSQNFSSSHALIGLAPNPSSPGSTDGYFYQVAQNLTYLHFTAPADGMYSAIATGNFTNQANLTQTAGSANKIFEFNGNSIIFVEIYTDQGSKSYYRQPFYHYVYDYYHAIPDFNYSISETWDLADDVFLKAGESLTFYSNDYSWYYAMSYNAPLPSTLLLLGSGLAGLLILNRRRGN